LVVVVAQAAGLAVADLAAVGLAAARAAKAVVAAVVAAVVRKAVVMAAVVAAGVRKAVVMAAVGRVTEKDTPPHLRHGRVPNGDFYRMTEGEVDFYNWPTRRMAEEEVHFDL
jgi:hypothetical protein